MTGAHPRPEAPDLSLVMPCYDEEDVLPYTVPRLVDAFERAGLALELVAVDNGSTDRTGEILRELAARHAGVVPHHVAPNRGYGAGILAGIPLCRADAIGIIPADGQVDAEDVVRLFEAVRARRDPVIGKVRRRFRLDGPVRKLVSVAFNGIFRILFPRIRSIDVNGTPKIVPRDALEAMRLESTGWFLDAEIMIKGQALGLAVLELNAFGRLRSAGVSNVRPATAWEIFAGILRYRFSSSWRRTLGAIDAAPVPRAVAARRG